MTAYSNLTVHSTVGIGMTVASQLLGTMSNITVWRANGVGMQLGGGDFILDTGTFFGCGISTFSVTGATAVVMINVTSNGDTTFSTTNGFATGGGGTAMQLTMINCDFSTVTGIKTAHTTDFTFSNTASQCIIKLINTKLGAATEISGQTNLSTNTVMSSQKHDQVATAHKTWRRYGTMEYSTTQAQAGVSSLRMIPNNASFKLESSGVYGGFKVQVASGQTCTPSVYVYEDVTYNGARARLILKRNDAIGIAADVVLDTATAASDAAWEQLTGTTAAATDNGTMEFVIDVDGTAGSVYVDTFSATVA